MDRRNCTESPIPVIRQLRKLAGRGSRFIEGLGPRRGGRAQKRTHKRTTNNVVQLCGDFPTERDSIWQLPAHHIRAWIPGIGTENRNRVASAVRSQDRPHRSGAHRPLSKLRMLQLEVWRFRRQRTELWIDLFSTVCRCKTRQRASAKW